MKTIFVVVVEYGSYSDYGKSLSCAFATELEAQSVADKRNTRKAYSDDTWSVEQIPFGVEDEQ